MNADVLKAIAELWPLGLVLIVLVAMIVFRRQIGELLTRITRLRFRRHDTRLEIDAPPRVQESTQNDSEQQVRPNNDHDEDRLLEVRANKSAGSEPEGDSGLAVIELLKKGEIDEAKRHFFASPPSGAESGGDAGDPEQSHDKKALFLAAAFAYANDEKALIELRQQASDPTNESANSWLGFTLTQLGEYEQAFQAYSTAAVAARDPNRAAEHIKEAAEALAKLGEFDRAEEYLQSEIIARNDAHQRARLYRGLASVYQEWGEPELRALALERAIELNPEMTTLRFAAGYAYSHVDEEHPLSLLHYVTKARVDEDDAATLNNLGVILERLGLSIRSVENYRMAFSKGNSLAGANLAQRLIDAGFGDEASTILEEASRHDPAHEMVGKAVGTLAEHREEERIRLERLIAEARREQGFLRRFATARFEARETADFSGTWTLDGSVVELKQHGDAIVGEYVLAGERHVLRGTAILRTATLSIETVRYSRLDGREMGTRELAQGKAYLSEDGQTISIMEMRDSERRYRELKRQPLVDAS